jgi:hypothetical protein
MLNSHDVILPEDISNEDSERILKKVSVEIVDRRLTAPAIFLLESCRPLSFIGSQAMIVLEPLVHAIFDFPDYRKFAILMEQRGNVEKLIDIIETTNHEQKLIQKQNKKINRELRK